MSDPHWIDWLTKAYLNYVNENKVPSVSDSKKANSTDNSTTIVTADELFKSILPQIESSDFYAMVFNGQQGSGKTRAAQELCHLAHTLGGYKLTKTSGMELLEAPDKIYKDAMGNKRVCIVIDDASYVLSSASGKTQSKIKNWYAMIRHALKDSEGNSAQIMVIVIAHFTTAVPPIFKNSNVWIFSKPTSQEYEAMVKVVGRGENSKLALETTFNAVREIQEAATKYREVYLNIKGTKFKFTWGDKHDPGDGRLLLLLNNGQPMIYNSKIQQCPECEFIGKETTFNQEDYQTKRPRDEDKSDE